ncbi:HNH endonuclease [Vibrio sp. 10N.222.55.C7]|uniref:HNH endonuclease n=1 Tax=Vibrio sp. 10N.222.55.C7 TaxID=3229650 RepID=UPI00354B389C
MGDYEGYSISPCGKLRNDKTGQIRKNSLNSSGYIQHMEVEGKHPLLHRLLAQTFIPNPEDKPYINHRNGIKDDNRLENLEWCTPSENTLHALEIGLQKPNQGGEHGCAKLTDEDVLAIHSDPRKSGVICKEYGITRTTLYHIRHKKTWKHLWNQGV